MKTFKPHMNKVELHEKIYDYLTEEEDFSVVMATRVAYLMTEEMPENVSVHEHVLRIAVAIKRLADHV